MKQIVNKALANQFLSGALIMLIGSNIANAIGFIYHFLMARILGKESYGELVAFLSIVSLCSMLYSFAGIQITKRVAEEKNGRNIFFSISKSYLPLFALVVILANVFILLFYNQVKISLPIAVIAGFVNLTSLFIFFVKSYYQGKSDFLKVISISNLEMAIRLILGVVLTIVGMSLIGTVSGYLIGSISALVLAYAWLRPSFTEWMKAKKNSLKKLAGQSLLPLGVSLGSTLILSSDVLITRYLLDTTSAATFSAASTVGRMVMFATMPIAAVILPILASEASGNAKKIASIGLLVTMGISLSFVVMFYLFGQTVVSILYGNGFESVVPYVTHSGINMSLLSAILICTNVGYAKGRKAPIYILVTTSILFPLLLLLLTTDISAAFRVTTAIFTFSLLAELLYFANEARRNRRINSGSSL